MTTSVKPVEPADHPAMATLNKDSKIALTINRLLWKVWPNDQAQYQNCLRAISTKSDDEHTTNYQLKVVDDATGELLGFLVYARNLPKGEEVTTTTAAKTDEPLTVPSQFNPAVFTAVMTSVTEFNKTYESIDHYKIIFTVIRPSHRRQGLCTKLMKQVMDRARADNLPVVTQAEPLAYEFFKALGFRDAGHVDWDLSAWAAEPRSGFGVFRLAALVWYP